MAARIAIDQETREICERAVRRFEELGCMVEEYAPDLGAIDEAFMVLRSQHFVVDRELQMQTHRDLLKPDIVWNTEKGLAQTPSRIAWAERERAAFFRRFAAMFETLRHLRLAQRRDAGVRCEPAASRVCRRQEARPTTWAPRR